MNLIKEISRQYNIHCDINITDVARFTTRLGQVTGRD